MCPAISVVVCTKNEEKWLEPCLKALKEQFAVPEIIIVDAHSTDKTKQIAKKYTKHVYNDNGKGLGSARNIGWKKAKAPIVAYCDADTKPPKDWTYNILFNIKLLNK